MLLCKDNAIVNANGARAKALLAAGYAVYEEPEAPAAAKAKKKAPKKTR
jgi:hypothetical protein